MLWWWIVLEYVPPALVPTGTHCIRDEMSWYVRAPCVIGPIFHLECGNLCDSVRQKQYSLHSIEAVLALVSCATYGRQHFKDLATLLRT